jgi:Concanavalin A-like lectin/glucanases superfamily
MHIGTKSCLLALVFAFASIWASHASASTVYDPNAACFYQFNTMLKSLPPQFNSAVPPYKTMRGGTLAIPSPTLVAAHSGNGLYFNGGGCYTVADNSSEINFGTGDFSISLWVKTTQSYGTLVEKRNNVTQAGYHLVLYSGKLLFQLGNATKALNFWDSSSVSINDNVWHHVAVTLDRDNTSGGMLFVDGKLIHTFNPTGLTGSVDNTAPLYLGKHKDGWWPLNGSLDDFYMSRQVLTPTEIAGIARAGSLQVSVLPQKGTWIWCDHANRLIEGDTTSIFSFLTANQVTEVYLHIDPATPASYYAAFIQNAKSRRISVQALVGKASWAFGSWPEFTTAMNYVQSYNASYPLLAFDALHIDVEPYSDDPASPWMTKRAETILNYQRFVAHAVQRAHAAGLQIVSDIPYWYDNGYTFTNEFGSNVTLLEWLFTNNDEICIMDYRTRPDYREAIDWTIAGAVEEFAKAKAHGKRLIVGVETVNGQNFLDEVFVDIGDYFSDCSDWGGAVHDLKAWMQL